MFAFPQHHGQGIAAKRGHRHIDWNHVVILVRPILAWCSTAVPKGTTRQFLDLKMGARKMA